LLDVVSLNSNILFPFIEHENLKAFAKSFDETSKKYLTETKATLVFIVNEFSQGGIKLKINDDEAFGKSRIKSNINELNNVDPLSINEIQGRFHTQILTAIDKGTPIGWINIQEGEDNSSTLLRHEGIVSCLREHVFSSKQPTTIEKYTVKETIVDEEANEMRSQSFWFRFWNFFSKQPDLTKQIDVPKTRVVTLDIIPRFIQFAFKDGSISELFPLYCLIDAKPKDKLPLIRVALISNRHFELDSIVETCILRNSEISRREEATIADQEKLSFEIALKFFSEILAKTDGVQLEVYHTGLEPAVIGTYRAFLSTILKKENRGKLIVTPKVFKGGGKFSDLKPWY
jgi:hypothetical protein